MHAPNPLASLPELTVDQAAAWITAALANESALRQHDELLFPATADAAALETANKLREAWQRWADEAELLLSRVAPLLKAKRHVPGAHDLDYAVGRARAMLQVRPEDHLRGLEEVRRGETIPVEEVRRELRAAPRR